MDNIEVREDGPTPEVRDYEVVFPVGTKVFVRNRFLGGWSTGFAVAEVLDSGYCLRRLSDGYVIPEVFEPEDVRLERRQDPLRWISRSYLDRRHD